MKILLVDNVSKHFPTLNKALSNYPHDVIKYNKLTVAMANEYDKIILSGGHGFSVLHPNKKYKKELAFVKKTQKPVLGICLGFELICRAYGAHVHDIVKYEHGLLKIKRKKSTPLFKGLKKSFTVYENHRHIVTQVGPNLIPLSYSKDGIEAVKHKSKPIWGVQFHPESFAKKNEGKKILINFLKM